MKQALTRQPSAPTSAKLLQRKCACGTKTESVESCPKCTSQDIEVQPTHLLQQGRVVLLRGIPSERISGAVAGVGRPRDPLRWRRWFRRARTTDRIAACQEQRPMLR